MRDYASGLFLISSVALMTVFFSMNREGDSGRGVD